MRCKALESKYYGNILQTIIIKWTDMKHNTWWYMENCKELTLCHKIRRSATQSKGRDHHRQDDEDQPESLFWMDIPSLLSLYSPIFFSLFSSLSFFQEICINYTCHKAAKERIKERQEKQRRDVIYLNFRFFFFLKRKSHCRSHCILNWHEPHYMVWDGVELCGLSVSAYQRLHS